jgi:RNA-directed DNA polymerase
MLEASTLRTRNGFGVDGESINDVVRARESIQKAISNQIASGTYAFSNLRPFIVSKASGKKRVICVPTVRDRWVQRALLGYLSDGDKCRLKNSVSFGFVPGRGVKRAATRACEIRAQLPFVYKTDISAFFDTIERQRLASLISSLVRQRSIHQLLFSALSCEISTNDPGVLNEIRDAKIERGKGIRQGMPLSPFFANLYLRKFDQKVIRRGVPMVRYADDLIFFADSEAAARDIHDFVSSELQSLGLEVPAIGPTGKTRVYLPQERAEFLGVELVKNSVGYVLEINQQQLDKATRRVAEACDPVVVRMKYQTLAEVQVLVRSIEIGYLDAYKFTNNVRQLENYLINERIARMRNLVETVTGIRADKLSGFARRFLGIYPDETADDVSRRN